MTEIFNKYIFDLPIIPKVVSDIISIPKDSDISSKEIEEILKVDPYLTARLLKIANSSFYSRQREIGSLKEAITLIGLNKIKTICLLIAGSEISTDKLSSFYKNFWHEAIITAFIAKSIASETGKSVIQDDIFTAGILHNIGQAILFNFSIEKYSKILNKIGNMTIEELEMEEFGISNSDVGAGVLQSWEFPQLLIDSIKYNLNKNTHSPFQSVIDIVSISRLIALRIINNELSYEDDNEFRIYQSRLNLRKNQIDFYLTEFSNTLKDEKFYNLCLCTVFG